jgi:hypothetical protein
MYDFDVRAYKDQLNKEWSEAKKDKTAKGQLLSNRLGRRWSLVHTATNNGVKSVSQLQHILLHKTCKWQLGDEMVNVFNEAKSVEWHDASDLEKYKDKAREFSSQWSDIYSEIGKKCKSVRTLQNRLGLPVNDNLQGDYDDYEVDAVTLEGMSPRKAALP